ncbi:exosortase A [Emcibacter nanhaiensis]|uniref:exosortase A n=1 Tax=Emcibacter nanhaiensis TaxID=1505037 RepID=UPI0015E2EF0E|nr:exosortase A [Emcibacter nanhaiensis]
MIKFFGNDLTIVERWIKTAVIWCLMLAVVLASFWQTISEVVGVWWNQAYYNHCLLIIPIVAYVLYERREIFTRLAPAPSAWGLLVIGAGAFVWFLGDMADTNVVKQFGLVVILQGTILTAIGVRAVHGLLFPYLYLYFLIPFGNFLIPTLQDITTFFVVKTLNLLDIPVYVEGVFLTVPNGKFHVAEACAGLRFLVATVALGLLMANIAYKTIGRQIIVVLLSLIVPVLANGVRATGIVLIGYYSEMQYAVGVDHLVYGWFFFALVLLLFISIAMTFTNRKVSDSYLDFSRDYWSRSLADASLGKWAFLVAVTFVLTAVAPLYSLKVENRLSLAEHTAQDLDPGISSFAKADVESNWHPRFKNADNELLVSYQVGEGRVFDLYMARYAYQHRQKEMIRFGNTVAAPKVWSYTAGGERTVEFGGRNYDMIEEIIHSHLGNRLVWYVYFVDDRFTNNTYVAKLYDARAKLLGDSLEAKVFAISIPIPDGNEKMAREALAEIAQNLPPIDTMLAGQGGKK